jgi:hypothetical protein
MQGWGQQSLFADLIAEEDLVAHSFRAHRRRSSLNTSDRDTLLQSICQSLQQIHMFLIGHEMEAHWISQLLDYIQRLHATTPAQTPEEQFNHLYTLRKWLKWVPISLLRRQDGKGPAMLTLAYFYATALTLEPLFPDLGAQFCSALALPPLEGIIALTSSMHMGQGADTASLEIASMMQYPQQAAFNYRARAMQHQTPLAYQKFQEDLSGFAVYADSTTYGNMSPAFAPATPQYAAQASSFASASASPFLEVPVLQSQILPSNSFGYGLSSWGALPSPGFLPQAYTTQDGQTYDMPHLKLEDHRGGFVSLPVWT